MCFAGSPKERLVLYKGGAGGMRNGFTNCGKLQELLSPLAPFGKSMLSQPASRPAGGTNCRTGQPAPPPNLPIITDLQTIRAFLPYRPACFPGQGWAARACSHRLGQPARAAKFAHFFPHMNLLTFRLFSDVITSQDFLLGPNLAGWNLVTQSL